MPLVAEISLLQARREFDRGYSYVVPEYVPTKLGSVAAVPFGKANRPAFGLVTALVEREDVAELKSLLYVLEEPYCLSEATVELCHYFSGHLLCGIGELARAALPTGLTFHVREYVVLHPNADPEHSFDSPAAADLFLMLRSGAKVEIQSRNREVCELLLRARLARKAYLPESAINQKFVRVIALACNPEKLDAGIFARIPLAKAEVYRSLLQYLSDIPAPHVPQRELTDRFHLTKSAITTLEKRGLIRVEAIPVYRTSYQEPDDNAILQALNHEQRHAFEALCELLGQNKGQASLLYGVTGSGKTRVMLHLIAEARRQDKGVIFLVPEIGLTSKAARELLAAFPGEVTVLHSGLSSGERHDAWVALKEGRRKIVLGTRSAVFAPVKNLGLIILDEEQDQSYNADNPPRYHARDIARFRAAHENALLLLASATPDIETFHKAQSGIYTLCRLNERAGGQKLPSVEIVDLKEDLKGCPDRLIGKSLQEAIAQTLSRGEQCLLFMNRRGYQFAPFCAKCGHVITCPNCSVSLTLHSQRGRFACCHYCGYSIPAPSVCPSCGAEHLFFKGYGTQRLEEEIRQLFPKARVLRMDADTVTQKLSHERLVESFAARKADILLGTQMIAKGHDFAGVTLVGVVMADTSLYLGDYRASEETFALLTQVIGRAGRAEIPGRAIIQTLNPDHEIFPLSASQDYDAFFSGEIALRKAVLYPPFCHLCVFTLACEREDTLNEACHSFNQQIAEELELDPAVKLIVYGPIEPAVLKVRNLYRKKFVIKHQNDRRTRALYARLIAWFYETQKPSVTLSYDATPPQI